MTNEDDNDDGLRFAADTSWLTNTTTQDVNFMITTMTMICDNAGVVIDMRR